MLVIIEVKFEVKSFSVCRYVEDLLYKVNETKLRSAAMPIAQSVPYV